MDVMLSTADISAVDISAVDSNLYEKGMNA
jgi:hypothetical protein